MIFAFSTSCPVASVAVLSPAGEILYSGTREAQGRASGACLEMLNESGLDVAEGTLFLADLGPGSFTGTRVGVTMAKTFAWANGVPCGGTLAFDLIDPQGTVVFPSKRGEWFVRRLDQELVRLPELPDECYSGFGPGTDVVTYPDAKRFSDVLSTIERVDPLLLEPIYLIEPSISVPKRQYGLGAKK